MKKFLLLALLSFLLVTFGLPSLAGDSVSQFHFISNRLVPELDFFNAEDAEGNAEVRKDFSGKISFSVGQFSEGLLSRGKLLYDEGRFAEAAEVWEQALRELEGSKELPRLVLTYNYLAIVYQDLGQRSKAESAIAKALEFLPKINDSLLYAQVLNTQGSLQLNTGQTEAALETWKQAERRYRSLKDVTGTILSQINQAQALQTLGIYQRAQKKLEDINQDLAALPDSHLKATGLRSLGVTLQVVGDLQKSELVLKESLAIAKRVNSPAEIGETLFSLGNTTRAKGDFPAALEFYQQAQEAATNPLTKLQAQLNQFSLLVKTKQTSAAKAILPKIQANLVNLSASRALVFAQVNLTESLMEMGSQESEIGSREIAQLLVKAVQQAKELKDVRAESYALGQLGHLYELMQQWSEALSLTERSLGLAQGIGATDIAAIWYWQQGRILKAQDQRASAIAAYDEAVKSLQSLRQDLVAVNPDVQFSFREQVEPVYRQFVQLLLQDVDKLPEQSKQLRLQRSREVIEGLQLAELENFFREACLVYKPRPIEEIDSQAAVIYPIVLDRSLDVVLSLPGKPLLHYTTEISPTEVSNLFAELRQSLNPVFLPSEVLPGAQKIYDLLLRPEAAALEKEKIKTLVFVLDGFLRSLPMAILHDGKQYLVEKYSIALTPGLQLLESRSLPFARLKTLAGGLAEARQGFAPLPEVKKEIEEITETVSSAQVLLDGDFTRLNFQNRVESLPFSVVHMATHGQFSSKAEDTFLLTWDDRINVKDLDGVLKGREEGREPIELLVLSACQTAKGDDRAALGLAGVAVRSGARSTLATLWSVQDRSTALLIAEFYRLIAKPGTSKSEALRQAQLSLLNSPQYQHPYYWSPFVLVGNWL